MQLSLFAPIQPAHQVDLFGKPLRTARQLESRWLTNARFQQCAKCSLVMSIAEKFDHRKRQRTFEWNGRHYAVTGGLYGPGGDFRDAYRLIEPDQFRGMITTDPRFDQYRDTILRGYHSLLINTAAGPRVMAGPPLRFTNRDSLNKPQRIR